MVGRGAVDPGAPELFALGSSPGQAQVRPSPESLAFELGHSGQDRQEQVPNCVPGGVEALAGGDQAATRQLQVVDVGQQVAG